MAPLKAGTKGSYTGSMAEAIEKAFQTAWPGLMDGDVPGSTPDMKLLFIAIAQGVVEHLKGHADSFKVEVDLSGGIKAYGRVNRID